MTAQTRRQFMATLSLAGAAGFAGALPLQATEGPLETTAVRLPKIESVCVAPQDVVADLLRAEGFTDIRHVPLPPGTNTPDAIARGMLDFGLHYAPVQVAGIDRGVAMKILAGIHVGCFELFVTDAIRTVLDLAGKKVGIIALEAPEHLVLSVIVANVGIDPRAQIDWVTSGRVRATSDVAPPQAAVHRRQDRCVSRLSAGAAGVARQGYRPHRR